MPDKKAKGVRTQDEEEQSQLVNEEINKNRKRIDDALALDLGDNLEKWQKKVSKSETSAKSLESDDTNDMEADLRQQRVYSKREQARALKEQIQAGGKDFQQLPSVPLQDKTYGQRQEKLKRDTESALQEAGSSADKQKRALGFKPSRLEYVLRGKNQGDASLGATKADGTKNFRNPETCLYSKEKPQMSPLAQLESSGMYSSDAKERKEQKKESERQIKEDYASKSFRSRRTGQSAAPGAGKNFAGKAAGKVVSKIAEISGLGFVVIYGLALLNDFPDLLSPFILFLSGGLTAFIDFFLDAIVFFGFRYFLRAHLNIPGIKSILYSNSFFELFPLPLDVLPFWTLCAWLCMRKIKEQAYYQKEGASRQQAEQARSQRLERTQAAYEEEYE